MKAFIDEAGSNAVRDLLSAPDLIAATSRLSHVECRAAFARLRRNNQITKRQEDSVIREFDRRWNDLVVADIVEGLVFHASDIVRAHNLRAADAIHLASALALRETDVEAQFACWDRKLWEAAKTVGFSLIPNEHVS